MILLAFLWISDPIASAELVSTLGVCGYVEAMQAELDVAMELRGLPHAELRIGGDMDCDWDVDLIDYGLMQIAYGRCEPDPTQARWDHPSDFVKFMRNAEVFGRAR
jgi:hypothetical protein